MNLHPDILAQSAFIDKPRTRKELYDVIGIVEEKMAVVRERQRNLATQQITGREEPRDSTGRQNVVDHVLPNVGFVAGWVTSNGIVIELSTRETGGSPVVQETPGEHSSWISKNYYESA